MKKRIFPFGIFTIIYLIVALAVLAFGIYITISQLSSPNGQIWRIIVIWVLFLIIGFLAISPIITYQVIIDGNTISMNKDFGLFEEDRVQSKTDVDLNKVKEYKLILSSKNSKGEPYKTKVNPRKFIAFTLNDENETVQRLFVNNMNKKQIIKLLDYIKDVTGLDVTNE